MPAQMDLFSDMGSVKAVKEQLNRNRRDIFSAHTIDTKTKYARKDRELRAGWRRARRPWWPIRPSARWRVRWPRRPTRRPTTSFSTSARTGAKKY